MRHLQGCPSLQLLATATGRTSDASTDATEKREQGCCAPLVYITTLQRGWGPRDQPGLAQSTAAPSPESPHAGGQRRRREHSSIPLQHASNKAKLSTELLLRLVFLICQACLIKPFLF